MDKLKGIFPVPVTPFRESDQSVDLAALEVHVEALLESGVHGFVANGSTSEAVMLDDAEYVEVARTIIKRVGGRVPVILGVAAPSTRRTLELCRKGADIGASAFLMLPPFFYRLNDAEIIGHYETIVSQTDLPIVLYNNPSSARADLRPELVAQLARIDRISYIKEATGDVARIYAIKALAGDRMDVFAGADNVFLDALVAGAVGAISASGNVLSSQMAEIYRLFAEQNDLGGASALFKRIFPLLQYIDGSPSFVQVIKTVLEILGRRSVPRSPLRALSGEARRELEELVRASGLAVPTTGG